MSTLIPILGTTRLVDADNNIEANFAALNTDKLEKSGGTMTGQLNFSGTTHAGVKLLSLTTAQRNALTPAEGMVIYNSTTVQVEAYQNSAWVGIASGVSDASTTVKGIVEEATDAELQAGTAAGGTSARLFAGGASHTQTPTANKVPVANSSGKLAAGWGGSASTLATLNGSALVVENPANAQTTPAASKIVISDATGKISDGWVGLTTAGDIGYSDGTDLQRLPIGTAGQVLRVNSGATAPEWGQVASTFATASDNLKFSADTTRNIDYGSYTLIKQIKIYISGRIRTKFDLQCPLATGDAKGRIYKDGVAFGTERTRAAGGTTTYTEDLTVIAGETLDLYCYHVSGSGAEVSNFRIYFDVTANLTNGLVVTD